MDLDETTKNKIKKKLEGEGAKTVAIFGSFIHSDTDPKSDLDILIEFSKDKTLFDIARIERELSKDLDLEVDLVTKNSLSPHFRKEVEKEKKIIMEK